MKNGEKIDKSKSKLKVGYQEKIANTLEEYQFEQRCMGTEFYPKKY